METGNCTKNNVIAFLVDRHPDEISGFLLADLRATNFSVDVLLNYGYSEQELIAAGLLS